MRRHGVLSSIIPGMKPAGEEKTSLPQNKFDIDYPQASETVARGHYAIRISGCEGECHVSIDEGDWQPCRSAEGFCWFDWNPTQTGRHRLSARTRSGNKWLKAQRTCEVK